MKHTPIVKHTPILATATLLLAHATAHSAVVASLSGDNRPDANITEAPNSITNAALFTTVVFSGTSWTADDGFIKMTTASVRGIWFGSHPAAGGDPGAFLPGSTSAGNKLQLRSLITVGSQSWSAYFRDTDGYRGRIDFEATDNSQNRPGVTVELATGFVSVGGPGFDLTELHDYGIHLHNGIVAYYINGIEVARGSALQPMEDASVLVGDPTGSTPTGTGSMWIDSFSFDNAAGPIPIPEPASTVLFGLATCLFASRRRREK